MTKLTIRLSEEVLSLLKIYMQQESIEQLNTTLDTILLQFINSKELKYDDTFEWPQAAETDHRYLYNIRREILQPIDMMMAKAMGHGFNRFTGASRNGIIHNILKQELYLRCKKTQLT